MRYAIIKDGAVVEEREMAPLDPRTQIKKGPDGLPLARPLVEQRVNFDPATHRLDGHSYAIFDDRVEKAFTVAALPPPPSPSEIYDAALAGDRVVAAFIATFLDGSLRPGLTPAEAKTAVLARM